MKLAVVLVLGAFLVFLLVQNFLIWRQGNAAVARFAEVAVQLEDAKATQEALTADFSYYLSPENLLKELRARFNYRAPDEKLIIIVPETSTPLQ